MHTRTASHKLSHKMIEVHGSSEWKSLRASSMYAINRYRGFFYQVCTTTNWFI